MLKRVQHNKKKYVIPNLFRNLEFGNDNELIAFVILELIRAILVPIGPFTILIKNFLRLLNSLMR
jgi:hypothetical protein